MFNQAKKHNEISKIKSKPNYPPQTTRTSQARHNAAASQPHRTILGGVQLRRDEVHDRTRHRWQNSTTRTQTSVRKGQCSFRRHMQDVAHFSDNAAFVCTCNTYTRPRELGLVEGAKRVVLCGEKIRSEGMRWSAVSLRYATEPRRVMANREKP